MHFDIRISDGFVQTKNWERLFNPQGTPRQLNGHDCGVFAMMCCNYISADREFDYSQNEIHSFFRKMCCLECYCMRLRSIDL
jgi:Ulp1 family protease